MHVTAINDKRGHEFGKKQKGAHMGGFGGWDRKMM